MKCINAKSFVLNANTILVCGIKCENTTGIFYPFVGIVQGDCITLCEDEWIQFLSLESVIKEYFAQPKDCHFIKNLQKHYILLNEEEAELVLKSGGSWHSVRISQKQYEQMVHFAPLINTHLSKIKKKSPFYTYTVQKIVSDVAGWQDTSENSIKELIKLMCDDTELFLIYSDVIVQLVQHLVPSTSL